MDRIGDTLALTPGGRMLDLAALTTAVKTAAAIRGRAVLEPAGGPADKVFPPTHSVANERTMSREDERNRGVNRRGAAREVPTLAGATVLVGAPNGKDAMRAWTTALGWLSDFRQGHSGVAGDRAREPGTGKPQPNRPSISNWPEADKVRAIARKTMSHPPRHNDTPAWPRAGFGLPIIGQFQRSDRTGGRYDEPGGFELRWHDGYRERDRLASPLIVKALPLADGNYVPCALWLHRAWPHGDVRLKGNSASATPFDRLVAPGDTPLFSALTGKATLHDAFVDWLVSRGVSRLTP